MATQRLMSEDEVLHYFIVNGGHVRNNDIVTHFRGYLANPAIRDEARALFKMIVNKLATVKVENSEKFLVLKRQYFPPIDGNGNPSSPASNHQQYYSNQGHDTAAISPPFIPFPIQAPPPYVRPSPYDHTTQLQGMTAVGPPFRQELSQAQQSNYHHKSASQFSLNTSVEVPSPIPNSHRNLEPRKSYSGSSGADFQFGLPPPPKQSPPRRLSFSSNSSMTAVDGIGISVPGRLAHIPLPYRPPPPVISPTSPPSRPIQPNFQSPTFQHSFIPPQQPPYRRTQSGLRSYSSSLSVFDTTTSPSSFSVSRDQIPATSSISTPPPPVPPRAKRSASFVGRGTPMEEGERCCDEKENQHPNGVIPSVSVTASSEEAEDERREGEATPVAESDDPKISVRERMQKFNNVVEADTSPPKGTSGGNLGVRREGSKDSGDYDTSSLSSFSYGYVPEPKVREWMLKAAKTDYAGVNKMAQEMPSLVRRKDMNGYTALHWAAKHGHVELVKLLAGTYKANVNAKSNGGYTPLHLAAQFSRQDVYDILITVYNADPNVRDHGGKKPMQYLVRKDTSLSAHNDKKVKDKRRTVHDKDKDRDSQFGNAFLRIGSLNVRVKKTTEAFGHFLGKSSSSSHVDRMMQKKWGSADSLPEAENESSLMPPPSRNVVVKSGGSSKSRKLKNRKSLQMPFPASPHLECTIPGAHEEKNSGSESDNACGFGGSEWKRTT